MSSSGQRNQRFTWGIWDDNGIVTAFALDPEGRVNAVTRAGVAAASYIYDAFNLRIAKTVAAGIGDETGSIHFVYDLDGRLIAEHDGATGEPLREYVYFGLMPVALVSYDGTGNASVYAVHTDQVNMPQKLTGTGGIVVHDRVTTPFGETISVTGVLTQTLRFPGQRNDSETGLFQNWHRDYDASLGRYVQSDPIGLAGGINTYSYVGGNPLRYVDRKGLNSIALPGGVSLPSLGGGVGALRGGGYGLAFYGAHKLGQAIGDAISPTIAKGLVGAGLVDGFTIDPNGKVVPSNHFKPIPIPANDNVPRGFCRLSRELDPDPSGKSCENKICQYKCRDGFTFTTEQAARSFSCQSMQPDPRGI